MAAITEEYVSFETAKLLKDKGFNEPTIYYYIAGHLLQHYSLLSNGDTAGISAPTLQMAMKWLREIHQIFIHIQRCKKFKFFFTIENMNISGENYEYLLGHFKEFERNTYEETCEAAIKYCLENLI